MENNELFGKYLNVAAKEGMCRSKANLTFYLDFLFQDVSFAGKSMLDIGGGTGLYSFYAAIRKAKHVVCLEPELKGSTKGILEKFKKLSDSLSINNVSLQPVRFQEFDAGNQTFDIILLHASINHLDEEACIKLQYDDDARKRYGSIFKKLSEIAAPGAKLIITDCSRHNFFALLGVRNPFVPMIEWHKHQSPEFWSNMLSDYGFVKPKIRWMSFSSIRKIGRLLFGNRSASYFLTSAFLLVMDKKCKCAQKIGIEEFKELKGTNTRNSGVTLPLNMRMYETEKKSEDAI